MKRVRHHPLPTRTPLFVSACTHLPVALRGCSQRSERLLSMGGRITTRLAASRSCARRQLRWMRRRKKIDTQRVIEPLHLSYTLLGDASHDVFGHDGVSCSPEVLHEYDHGIDQSKLNPKSVVHLRQARTNLCSRLGYRRVKVVWSGSVSRVCLSIANSLASGRLPALCRVRKRPCSKRAA